MLQNSQPTSSVERRFSMLKTVGQEQKFQGRECAILHDFTL